MPTVNIDLSGRPFSSEANIPKEFVEYLKIHQAVSDLRSKVANHNMREFARHQDEVLMGIDNPTPPRYISLGDEDDYIEDED